MAASITLFNAFRESLGDGTIDLDTHTFKVLLLATGAAAPVATNSVKTDLGSEHANANGYTTGGATLASVTWNRSGGTVTFDAADTTWTASGGSIVSRYAVIYDDTATNDDLVAFVLLDTTPADVTTTTGNTLTLQWNASGIFALS